MRLVLIGLLLVASLASAQTEPKQPKPQTIDFSEVVIGGDRDLPSVAFYDERPKVGPFPCLIKVRTSFTDKLRESVHEM
jgi:hypothetical protein